MAQAQAGVSLEQIMTQFLLSCLRLIGHGKTPWHDVLDVVVKGYRSAVFTVALTSLFVGAIMVLEMNRELSGFGAEFALGGLATSLTLRNIGPVLLAFLLIGKMGTQTCALLAAQASNLQLDAISLLGGSPLQWIVLPQFLGITLVGFLLLMLGLFFTSLGGIITAQAVLQINSSQYVAELGRFVGYDSLVLSMLKSAVFSFLIALNSAYFGSTALEGASHVGPAVRRAAVGSMLGVLTSNLLLTKLFDILSSSS